MPNLINESILRQLSDDFASAEGMVVVSMDGLSVAETEALRNQLADRGVRLRMVRNRLARKALETRGVTTPRALFAGNTACAWGSSEDAIGIAKAVDGCEAKRLGKVKFKGGLFEGDVLDPAGAAALAGLPGKNELRAMMLGLLSGPARSLATLLNAPGSSIARAIQARVDKGGEAAS